MDNSSGNQMECRSADLKEYHLDELKVVSMEKLKAEFSVSLLAV
jgi:hypothetical protein